MTNTRRIRFMDTTLRDGEQSPGATLYPEEKIRIARQLMRLGVDAIEPGFAAASPGEFQAIQHISRMAEQTEIVGFARAVKGDIDAAVQATEDAPRRRLHLFISTSQIHLEHQLRKTREEVLAIAGEMVSYAKQFADRIEFSPMDASRSDEEYLHEMIETVIAAGATIINIPDTVGYALPDEYGALFARVRKQVRGGENVEYSAHCHNDLGMAVANSLAALRAGATYVEASINGIGERAGNCSLEELAMAILTREHALGFEIGIDPSQIYETSRLVSRLMHFPVAYNKPIVGRNAFSHESGIHQDGLLKNRQTYEIMDPDQLGIPRNMIVLGKHSGRHALKSRVEQYGIRLDEEQLNRLAAAFKEAADRQKHVSDHELLELLGAEVDRVVEPFSLRELQLMSGSGSSRVASAQLRDNRTGEEKVYAAAASGPIEALILAIKQAIPLDIAFEDMEIHSLSSRESAKGEAQISIEVNGERFRGSGIDKDIFAAAGHAFLSACNQAVGRFAPESAQPAKEA